MSTADTLAKVIRQRYDQCPPGKWPMEESLAEFILEHAAEAGLAVIELPQANHPSGLRWPVVVDGEPEDLYVCDDEDSPIVISGIAGLNVAEAEGIAAALLAATAAVTA